MLVTALLVGTGSLALPHLGRKLRRRQGAAFGKALGIVQGREEAAQKRLDYIEAFIEGAQEIGLWHCQDHDIGERARCADGVDRP